MTYQIREKFWSWGDDFKICDNVGRPVFQVKGKAFSWGDKLSFQDMAGQELAFISQKMFSMMPRYEIHRNGQLFAEVVKEFRWFSKEFTLDVPGPNDYTIKGRFWTHDYEFTRGGRVVANVSKEFFSMSDVYGVQIVDGEDDVAILAACIVIDQVLHDGSGSSSVDFD
ncbi:Tubby C2 family protein [Haloferula helveola]|uniref:Tubby C2 family protein n=1 Tax=Haloferula helveola TaxID=490095 RepID=A0ABM7RBJ2_9BACT|nr:Tubby C2 family protein [Haloferula helveola]